MNALKSLEKPHRARSRQTKTPATPSDGSKDTSKPFPVVGFGASAGGLEAFTLVLKNLDPNLGMAYILIMHLSPNHKSSLTEILQHKTKMKVHTVKDGMEVKPNNVYVIPPNAFMSLVNGRLTLAPRALNAIGNFAVDYFLTALASNYKNNSIGIILSGTATDGTLGLKAIKAEGGITIAQDKSAKFPGMPQNAYDAGYADVLLSPEEIAQELAHLVKIPYTVLPSHKIERQHEKELRNDTEVLKKILLLVKAKSGIDFFIHYKRASVYRRVVRRIVLNKCTNLVEYYSMLDKNEKEVDALYNDFLINVTHFFRDPDFYKTLAAEVFPALVKQRKPNDPIRIWVAGCATGEEAYSIAINLTEFLENKDLDISFQIFASDLDTQAIEKARLGIYPISALQSVPQNQIKRFFKKVDGHYQIVKSVRESCIFSQQNLLKDPPFSRMDLISCQNVLIYLETNPQQRILQTFHYALKPSGYLFIGKSESLGAANDLFDPLDKKIRIYRKKPTNTPTLEFFTNQIGFVPNRETYSAKPLATPDIEKEMGKILLTRFVQPSVVLNQKLNIIQFFGITAPYLGPIVGKASFNVLKMIREDLLIDLKILLQLATKTGKIAIKEGIKINNKTTPQEVTIEVVPKKEGNEFFFLVVFKETQIQELQKFSKGKSKNIQNQKEQTIIELEDELNQSREVIRTTTEEYETTYEELQAHNEEILSSNEELQSVNEELETSKEELQSANEELTTINDELQRRNVELKESQNYAKAIVDTVHNPFLVLTSNLQVRSGNTSFYETFKLLPEKTEGSFIYELGNNTWDIPALREHLNELLAKKINYVEFELKHFFPEVGELVFIVNAYKLFKDDETLILLAFINIGNVVKANHELQLVNEHLEQFAFIASHDLQEPLRKIAIFSNFLSGCDKFDSHTKLYIDKINSTATRMSLLLKDLLAYSVLLKNKENMFVPVDLNLTTESVTDDLEIIIEEKGAVLNISSLPIVEAVPVQMYQLFYHLISNALKFNNGQPNIKITTEEASSQDYEKYALKNDKSYACVRVHDNGIGFDQQYAGRIFTIFQKLRYKPEAEGSGIGLSFCKKIVEYHGGAIIAEGEEGKGAIFSVFLPTV